MAQTEELVLSFLGLELTVQSENCFCNNFGEFSMESTLPTVEILLSIYKPRLDWFIAQLDSLNAQTYSNLCIIVANDCPEDPTEYKDVVLSHITRHRVRYFCNSRNLGTTCSFAQLTKFSTAQYLAYCDQDDVWLPNKIEKLVETALVKNADLVCSDMQVIDAEGRLISDSVTSIRSTQNFCTDSRLRREILLTNYVYGCAMLVERETALASLPIPKPFYHDWWMALYVVLSKRRLEVIKVPLLQYRIAGQNQTGFLTGVCSKEEYRENIIRDRLEKIQAIKFRFHGCGVDEFLQFYEEYFFDLLYLFERFNFIIFFSLVKRSCDKKFKRKFRQIADCLIAITPSGMCNLLFFFVKTYKNVRLKIRKRMRRLCFKE